MPDRLTLGRTIQNFASSIISPAARLEILATTSTFEKSSVRCTTVTWPMFTSLYLIIVVPASMPSAARNTMVIVGPSLRARWTTIPTATSAARTGMIQTIDSRWRFGATTIARGSWTSSTGSAMRTP